MTLLWLHGLKPIRLLCPWDFPGKNTGMGCHFLLQGIFPTQGLNLHLFHWQVDSFYLPFSSIQFSRSVMSDSFQPHGLQHTRPPCPSPTPGVYSNSCSLSQWCHPAISSSVIPFSSCPQSLPASGSFPMSQLLTSGSQSIGAGKNDMYQQVLFLGEVMNNFNHLLFTHVFSKFSFLLHLYS